MWARIERATGRLRHWSVPAFTVPPSADEMDQEFPEGTRLPDGVLVRVVDGTLVADPPPPLPPPRASKQEVKAALEAATDAAGLKAAMLKLLERLP